MQGIQMAQAILVAAGCLHAAQAQLSYGDGYEGHYGGLEDRHKHIPHEEQELDYHAHPKYSYDYSVKDPLTGDVKDHWETRDGDKVKGSYSLLESDGTKRVVEYESDNHSGFNAIVHKIGEPKADIKVHSKPTLYSQYGAGGGHEGGHEGGYEAEFAGGQYAVEE